MYKRWPLEMEDHYVDLFYTESYYQMLVEHAIGYISDTFIDTSDVSRLRIYIRKARTTDEIIKALIKIPKSLHDLEDLYGAIIIHKRESLTERKDRFLDIIRKTYRYCRFDVICDLYDTFSYLMSQHEIIDLIENINTEEFAYYACPHAYAMKVYEHCMKSLAFEAACGVLKKYSYIEDRVDTSILDTIRE
jgi:hypothetical protein